VSTWDAGTYEKVASPQETWAREIIARADLRPGERVLDAGCGGGRVTSLLLEQGAEVVAVDGDAAMVAKARETLPDSVPVLHQDLLDLEVDAPVDVVFSCAVFHWITDHDTLFSRLHAALKPGGRLVAQCGGAGNVATLLEAIAAVDHPAFAGWDGPWNFATTRETKARLEAAGFRDVWTWPQHVPVMPEDPREYLTTVMLGSHLARLPEHERDDYADAVLEALGPRPTFEYVRLNMLARS
jgi:trans-aconitate 2-methyltransferase